MSAVLASSCHARRAGVALGLAALLAIAGFTALGMLFGYPQILQQPVDQILALFVRHQTAIMAWFGVLMVSAALMAPAGLWIGSVAGGGLGRAIRWSGIAAAVVQVAGLQRWLTLVPLIADDAHDPARHESAVDRFAFWHRVLGTAIGETLGYLLTATFTVVVIVALRRQGLPRWLAVLGYGSATLIATGILVPLVQPASLTNFLGYVLWCAWLLVISGILIRGIPADAAVATNRQASPG